MKHIETELNFGGRTRIYRKMPELSERLLGKTSRTHLVRTTGAVCRGLKAIPFAQEMIDVHGTGAQELLQVLRLEGKYGKVLELGDKFAVRNPSPKFPDGGADWALIREHEHPDNI